jgi:hypothetical protein
MIDSIITTIGEVLSSPIITPPLEVVYPEWDNTISYLYV